MNASNKIPDYREWLNLDISDPLKEPLPSNVRVAPLSHEGTTRPWYPRMYNAVKAYSDFIYDMSWEVSADMASRNGLKSRADLDRELTAVHNALNKPTQFALLRCFYEEGIVRQGTKLDYRYHGGGWVSLWMVECWLSFYGEADNAAQDAECLRESGFFPIPLTTNGTVPSELFLCMALRFFYVNNVLRYSLLNTYFQQLPAIQVLCFCLFGEERPENESVLKECCKEAKKIMCEKTSAPVDLCYLKTQFLKEASQVKGAKFLAPSLLDDLGWIKDRNNTYRPLPARFEHMGPYMSTGSESYNRLTTCALLLGTFIGHPRHSGRVFFVEGLEPDEHLYWQSCFFDAALCRGSNDYEEVEPGPRQDTPKFVKVTQSGVESKKRDMRCRREDEFARIRKDAYERGRSDGIAEVKQKAYIWGDLFPLAFR